MELSAVIIAELAFKKFLETSAGELSKQFTSKAIQKMDELRQVIWDKLRGNSKAEQAIRAIENGSKSELDRLGVYLDDLMEDDLEFANQLQLLAQEVNQGKLQDNSTMNQTIQDNGRGVQTKIEGGTNYVAAEMHIHQSPNS